MKNPLILIILSTLLISSANASVVTVVTGAETDFGVWRTSSEAKSFDIANGSVDNIYGTDGYVIPRDATTSLSLTPSYVQTLDFPKNWDGAWGPSADYGVIDNPSGGVDLNQFLMGYDYDKVGNVNFATITLGSSLPAQIRIGIVLGNHVAGENPMADITMTAGASSATVSVIGNPYNSPVRAYFFDITDPTPADTINLNVSYTGGAGKRAYITGLTFDSIVAVPEPSSAILFLLGGLLLLLNRMQRRS